MTSRPTSPRAGAASSPSLLLRALRGEATPRRPAWVMRQAGRCLPEYRRLRERYSFEELRRDPQLAAEVTLLPLRRFRYDAAITFADIMSPIPALGIPFRFAPGPVIEQPLRDAAAIDALPDPDRLDDGAIAPEVLETQRLVRARLDDSNALLGFAGAPLTLAAYLVEGQGSRAGFPAIRALAHADPAAFGRLLGKLTRLVARYLVSQVRAGADAVQIFDSWAGLLAVDEWHRLVRPHLVDLLEELGRAGVVRILFVHDAPQLVPACVELPAEVLAVDWRFDLAELRRLRPHGAVQGNLDPAILLAGPEATFAATKALLARVPALGHIVNLGHGVLPQTPLESVDALLEAVHSEARDAA